MRCVAVTSAASLLLISPAVAQDRTLATYQGYAATVPAEESWCGPEAVVQVAAPASLGFKGGQDKLGRLVGGLRAIVSVECPAAKSLRLIGLVDGAKVYEGVASAQSAWALAEVAPPSAEELKIAADLAQIESCDDLGGYPGDPEGLSEGVADADLNANDVIAACTKAVAIDDESPRLKFQLGRGYLKAGRLEDAIDQFLPAAEADHGGALAYLGEIYLQGGVGIEADPTQARSLYQRAVASGFEPAKVVLASFDDQTEQVAQAEAEEREANAASVATTNSAPAQKAAGSSKMTLTCEVQATISSADGTPGSYFSTEPIIHLDFDKGEAVMLGTVPTVGGKFLFEDKPYKLENSEDQIRFGSEALTEGSEGGTFIIDMNNGEVSYWQQFVHMQLLGLSIPNTIQLEGYCSPKQEARAKATGKKASPKKKK